MAGNDLFSSLVVSPLLLDPDPQPCQQMQGEVGAVVVGHIQKLQPAISSSPLTSVSPFPGGQEDYVLSYEPVTQQEGTSRGLHASAVRGT